MKKMIFLFSAVAALSLLAMPRLTDVSVVEDDRHVVTISYKLADAPGVVTLDIQTNDVATGAWASIGGENITPSLTGKVGTYVENGNDVNVITWRPNKSWPGHRFVNNTAKAVLTAWPTNAPPLFMVVDLTDSANRITYYPDKSSVPGGITHRMYKTDKILLRRIPAAGVTWNMGSPTGECKSRNDNEDLHPVTLTEDYYMGVYETTCQQFDHVRQYAKAQYGSFNEWRYWNGSKWTDMSTYGYDSYFDPEEIKTCPVSQTYYYYLRGKDDSKYNWPANGHDVINNGFFGALRALAGNVVLFDLPTEAQWEFAARAGTSTQTYFGNPNFTDYWGRDDAMIDPYCWTDTNAKVVVGTTTNLVAHPVGLKLPNGFDLYDVLGNVVEACLDQYQAHLGTDGAVDPQGPTTGTANPSRVHRGGACRPYDATSWYGLRSAWRDQQAQTEQWGYYRHGFRIWAPAVVVKQP